MKTLQDDFWPLLPAQLAVQRMLDEQALAARGLSPRATVAATELAADNDGFRPLLPAQLRVQRMLDAQALAARLERLATPPRDARWAGDRWFQPLHHHAYRMNPERRRAA
jgi:hypothetical protein